MVSRREFFRVGTSAVPPVEYTRDSAREYLEYSVVSEARSRLAMILAALDLPRDTTTVADMPDKLDSIETVERGINDFIKELQSVQSPSPGARENPVITAVAQGTGPILKGLANIRRAEGNNDAGNLEGAAIEIAEATAMQWAIEEAIATLRASHGLDD